MAESVEDQVRQVFRHLHAAVSVGNAQRAHQLTNELEVFARSYLVPNISDEGVQLGLNGTILRIFARLRASEGKVVSREQLQDALYYDRREDNVPYVKIVDVLICKLRNKITNSNYAIKTIWGTGYMLVKHDAA